MHFLNSQLFHYLASLVNIALALLLIVFLFLASKALLLYIRKNR